MATHTNTISIETGSPSVGLLILGHRGFKMLRQALAVRRERKALLSLSERMLTDIGISHADAHREAHRPFMDLPLSLSRAHG